MIISTIVGKQSVGMAEPLHRLRPVMTRIRQPVMDVLLSVKLRMAGTVTLVPTSGRGPHATLNVGTG